MAEWKSVAWQRLTQDNQIYEGPCLLYGVVVLANSGGGSVAVYDTAAKDTSTQVALFKGGNNLSNPIMFPLPLELQTGLYVDLVSHVDEALILWRPRQEKV